MEEPLAWLKGEIKTPPFSADARIEAGYLLRRLQEGERLGLPQSRPCQRSLRVAMSFGFGIVITSGESFTGSIPTPS